MAIKAEIVKTEDETPTLPPISEFGVPNVELAVESWEAYLELCKRLLDEETDFQYYQAKEKDENGKDIMVTRRFPKKSAWFKLGRAFNVDTEIVEKTVERGKNGQVKEAYYRVKAWLPNGQRTVEADASCDVWEKGKSRASGHDLRTTAETRATNRAIAKLIGAGEVSAEEINSGDMKRIKDVKILKGE